MEAGSYYIFYYDGHEKTSSPRSPDAIRVCFGKRRQTSQTKPSGTVNIPCPTSIKKIEDCTDVGCSNERKFDPHLNEQKNLRGNNTPVEDWDFSRVAALDDPVQAFFVAASLNSIVRECVPWRS